MEFNEKQVFQSFETISDANLKNVHLFLNNTYHKLMFSEHEADVYDLEVKHKLMQIEMAWIKHEKNKCLQQYDCDMPISSINDVEAALKKHPVYGHQIFDLIHASTIQTSFLLDNHKHHE